MDQLEFSQEDFGEKPSAGSDTLAIFLGLYLLILAFFIILVSISQTEEIKAKAVQDSLTTTFASILSQPKELTSYTGQSGEIVAGQQFLERIEGLFSTAIQVAKVETMQPGKQMRITMPSDTLYFPEKIDIRPAQYPLMDRIVASISGSPPGLRFDVEYVIGREPTPEGGLPIGQTLEMGRAGAFAREMRSRGAPPGSVVIGMIVGKPDIITMNFYVRNDDVPVPAPQPAVAPAPQNQPTQAQPVISGGSQ